MIESTGYKPTAADRERDAVKHIVHVLARLETQLTTLDYPTAAAHCQAAILELREETT